MSEMVERATLALFDQDAEWWERQSRKFRAFALKDVCRMIAAMREPTEGMIEAALDTDHTIESMSKHPDAKSQIEAFWQAMLDEALK
jgi:hypothetical protein